MFSPLVSQMHTGVVFEADLPGHLMGIVDAAQLGDHFDGVAGLQRGRRSWRAGDL